MIDLKQRDACGSAYPRSGRSRLPDGRQGGERESPRLQYGPISGIRSSSRYPPWKCGAWAVVIRLVRSGRKAFVKLAWRLSGHDRSGVLKGKMKRACRKTKADRLRGLLGSRLAVVLVRLLSASHPLIGSCG